MSPTPNSRPEMLSQLAVACLGAGIVTTVAVAQGQNPLTALGITLFSAIAAVMVVTAVCVNTLKTIWKAPGEAAEK